VAGGRVALGVLVGFGVVAGEGLVGLVARLAGLILFR
jgi:hypothetical protein